MIFVVLLEVNFKVYENHGSGLFVCTFFSFRLKCSIGHHTKSLFNACPKLHMIYETFLGSYCDPQLVHVTHYCHRKTLPENQNPWTHVSVCEWNTKQYYIWSILNNSKQPIRLISWKSNDTCGTLRTMKYKPLIGWLERVIFSSGPIIFDTVMLEFFSVLWMYSAVAFTRITHKVKIYREKDI